MRPEDAAQPGPVDLDLVQSVNEIGTNQVFAEPPGGSAFPTTSRPAGTPPDEVRRRS